MLINSGKSSLSLNSAANQCNRKAVQAEINIMNVNDSVHCFRGTDDVRVREEIDIFEKQISSKFSKQTISTLKHQVLCVIRFRWKVIYLEP